MRISITADRKIGVATSLESNLRLRGHEVTVYGVLGSEDNSVWASGSLQAAQDVAEQRADQAIICCFTGTGASIAANKVSGVRAALCHDAFTAAGARRWNDANALCLSLRMTSDTALDEILDAWFSTVSDNSQRTSIDLLTRQDGASRRS